jgi:hypothetical protein
MKPQLKAPTKIEGRCSLHPWAKLICPVCAGRKGGRGRKGKRSQRVELMRMFKTLRTAFLPGKRSGG